MYPRQEWHEDKLEGQNSRMATSPLSCDNDRDFAGLKVAVGWIFVVAYGHLRTVEIVFQQVVESSLPHSKAFHHREHRGLE